MIGWLGIAVAAVGSTVLFYAYIGYPLYLAALIRIKDRPLTPASPIGRSIAIVISARDEQANLRRRLEELTGMIARLQMLNSDDEYDTGESLDRRCEVIVVSDGSTDQTAAVARSFQSRGVRTIEWTQNRGKAAALSEAVRSTICPIVAFADARQRWGEQTLEAFLHCFRDPDVGGVSGELVLEQSPGVLAGVGAYWNYEKWIRRCESRLNSQIGVTGAIAAVRRDCFCEIPAGTILDDVYWPMQVVAQGKRVVFESRAKAFDRLPADKSDEFRRKVRTLAGNFQLVARCPSLLDPGRNPVWFAFVSHKLMRLLCPWAAIAVALGCLMAGGVAMLTLLALEMLFLTIGLLGLFTSLGRSSRVASAIGSFVLLNAAALFAFWYWATDRTDQLWSRSIYTGAAGSSTTVDAESQPEDPTIESAH